jgi:hypothetical protein
MNEAVAELVIAGAVFVLCETFRVNACVAAVPNPFEAVTVNVYVPAGVAVVLVRTPAVENVTPVGSVPDSVNVGAGNPVAVTVNELAVPAVKVADAALVIAAAWSTFRVKD